MTLIPPPLTLSLQEDWPEEFRQLSAVLQKTVEGISRLTPEGCYMRVNPAYARMLGYEPEELIGQSWEVSVHPDDRDRIREFFETMRAEGKVTGEVKGLRKDGDGFYKEVFMVAVYDRDQTYTGLYCLTKDITERKRAELRLTAMTEGLREVAVMADELISCPDLDTVFRRAVELAREKLGLERCVIFLEAEESFTGTYGTDRHGQTTFEHGNSFERCNWWQTRMRRLPTSTPPWIIEDAPYYDWDGSKAVKFGQGWIAITPILPSDTSQAIGMFVNDRSISGGPPDECQQEIVAAYCSLLGNIIQRKRAEEDRARSLEREREKSEQLQLAIREAHHRIKNNLQAVSDLLYLELSSEAVSPPRKVLQTSMERIRAIALVHDLLSQDEDVRQVNLKGMADLMVRMVLTGYGRSPESMDLALKVPPVRVSSRQATALALILNELVSNAAKHAFNPERRARLEVCLETEGEDYVLSIRDNGPGLPDGFDLDRDANVGLEVARTLADRDLKGRLEVDTDPTGLMARVRFPRQSD